MTNSKIFFLVESSNCKRINVCPVFPRLLNGLLLEKLGCRSVKKDSDIECFRVKINATRLIKCRWSSGRHLASGSGGPGFESLHASCVKPGSKH